MTRKAFWQVAAAGYQGTLRFGEKDCDPREARNGTRGCMTRQMPLEVADAILSGEYGKIMFIRTDSEAVDFECSSGFVPVGAYSWKVEKLKGEIGSLGQHRIVKI